MIELQERRLEWFVVGVQMAVLVKEAKLFPRSDWFNFIL